MPTIPPTDPPVDTAEAHTPTGVPSDGVHAEHRRTDPDWLSFIERMEARADRSREKQSDAFAGAMDRQTTSFTGALGGMRTDMRVFGVLLVLGILALSGVQVVYGGAGPASLTLGAEPPEPDGLVEDDISPRDPGPTP
jgi:hypothetical protein